MKIHEKVSKLYAQHEKDMHSILSIFEAPFNDYEDDFRLVATWIMTTELNPYSYLPEHWAGCVDTASGLNSLLGFIHHAMCDDGDIVFLKKKMRMNSSSGLVVTNVDEFTIEFIDKWTAKERYPECIVYVEPNSWTVDKEQSEKEWVEKVESSEKRRKAIMKDQVVITSNPAS